MSVKFLGFDADGDKVWQHADGRVVYNPTQQGAEWAFESGCGRTLDAYSAKFGPITKERQ